MQKVIDGLRFRLTIKGIQINKRFRANMIGKWQYDFKIGLVRNGHHLLNWIESLIQ